MTNASLALVDLQKFANSKIGSNVKIYSKTFLADGYFEIGDDVVIEAENVRLGDGCRIEHGVRVKGLGSVCSHFSLGDESFLGFSNQILVPHFEMGDYSQIHNSGLHSGYKPLVIGHNCWIGQNSILNSTETLKIGNNCRIGTGSQLWTHVASGELMEGCTLLGFQPLTLEDNVWIVGGAVISPGLLLKKNTIVMTGSVLTKSTEEFHTYAGVPAKDITDKLSCWKPVDIDWKFSFLKEQTEEFFASSQQPRSSIVFVEKSPSIDYLQSKSDLIIVCKEARLEDFKERSEHVSIFDVTSKRYIKSRTRLEKSFLKYLVGYRARFIPI